MIESNQVVQVARAVANGDGDWANVQRCVREAILLALAGPFSLAAEHDNPLGSIAPSDGPYSSSWPALHEEAETAPSLTEEMVQQSVHTFDDAAWLRYQAVRSFAQFHNTIEGMREAMRHQLRSLWRTAVQLDPGVMDGIRQQLGLTPQDEIPENTTISGGAAERLTQLEEMVAEIEYSVEALRAMSVRFAANMLSDDEKRAMGLDPADLRPEDVQEYPLLRPVSVNPYGSCIPGTRSSSSMPHTLFEHGQPKKAAAAAAAAELHEENSAFLATSGGRSGSSKPMDDAVLRELRKRFTCRMSLLNEALPPQAAGSAFPYQRPSSSVDSEV